MAHGPDRRNYQSPEIVLAEARRMAAEIRRQAERDAAMVRRDAAEWASAIRREAEQRARLATEASVEPVEPVEPEPEEPAASAEAVGEPPPLIVIDVRDSDVGGADVDQGAERDADQGADRDADQGADVAQHPAPAPDLDPYEIGRRVALGSWMSAADFDGPSRPTAVASAPLPRHGDVIDLRQAVEARRSAAARQAEDAARTSAHATAGHVPIETSIESKVHEVVRLAVRRTFSRRSS